MAALRQLQAASNEAKHSWPEKGQTNDHAKGTDNVVNVKGCEKDSPRCQPQATQRGGRLLKRHMSEPEAEAIAGHGREARPEADDENRDVQKEAEVMDQAPASDSAGMATRDIGIQAAVAKRSSRGTQVEAKKPEMSSTGVQAAEPTKTAQARGIAKTVNEEAFQQHDKAAPRMSSTSETAATDQAATSARRITGTTGEGSLPDGVAEYAKTHEDTKEVVPPFQKDADQIYPGRKEEHGHISKSPEQLLREMQIAANEEEIAMLQAQMAELRQLAQLEQPLPDAPKQDGLELKHAPTGRGNRRGRHKA